MALVLCWYQEEYCIALVEKESGQLLSALVCWECSAGPHLRQACHALHGMLVLPLLGLNDSFFFQVDGREHHS